MKRFQKIAGYVAKLLVSGLAFALASLVASLILRRLGVSAPPMPAGASEQKAGLLALELSPLLAFGLAPLAAGLAGSGRARWAAVAFLIFINLGVNTVVEALIFTTQFASGGALFLILMEGGAAAAFSVVVVYLFRPAAPAPSVQPRRSGWAWRMLLAWAAFPIIYVIFGLTVSPVVVARYRAGIAGLRLPSLQLAVPVELGRSALFLLASLPPILLWQGSRRRLILALGWADAVTTGIYGLLGAYWLPGVLRVAHSLEITADSFAYAFVLVMLFRPRAASAAPAPLRSSRTA
jgi:hypothetical protein